MTQPKYKAVLDAEAWVYIARIVTHIPTEFSVASCPDDAALIRGLGGAGAFRALMAMQDALQVYFSDLIFAAVRAACSRPMAVVPIDDVPLPDEEEWASMFAVPWQSDEA